MPPKILPLAERRRIESLQAETKRSTILGLSLHTPKAALRSLGVLRRAQTEQDVNGPAGATVAWTVARKDEQENDTTKRVKYTVAEARSRLSETPTRRSDGMKSPTPNGSSQVHPSGMAVPNPLTRGNSMLRKQMLPPWGIEQIRESQEEVCGASYLWDTGRWGAMAVCGIQGAHANGDDFDADSDSDSSIAESDWVRSTNLRWLEQQSAVNIECELGALDQMGAQEGFVYGTRMRMVDGAMFSETNKLRQEKVNVRV